MEKRVLVIGGGIIGLCSAYYLQKEGHRVTVLDKSWMDTGASYVNAGYLTPSHIIPLAAPGMITKGIKYMFDPSSPLYLKPRWDVDFFKWAWAFKRSSTSAKVAKAIPHICDINIFSRELFDELKTSKDLGDFHYERKGLLMLFQTEKEGTQEMDTAEKGKELGLQSDILGEREIREIEPNINIKAKGAVHYHCDGHTTPTQFMQKMKDYLQAVGVGIINKEEVVGFDLSNGKITSVKSYSNSYAVDEVVFAAGSWTSDLAKKLKVTLPMQAGKGYRIDVSEPTGISMPAILLEAKIAVTPMNGFTRFAGTMEFAGINDTIQKKRVEAIAGGVSRFYDGLEISEIDKEHAQCGLRPVSPDGLPYIGRVSHIKNLVMATGHAMMGWSLGPATGKLVSELVSEKPLSLSISPYHPERNFN